MTIVCGIDPGQTGGIAIVEFNQEGGRRKVLDLIVMPDIHQFVDAIGCYYNDALLAHIFIEKAQCMPKQGISSAFNYGRHFGELLGAIAAVGIPFTCVPPGEWTKNIHAGTATRDNPKARTLEACQRLYPKQSLLATMKSKVPHSGLVDALMIAEYGVRKMTLK